MVNIAKGGPVVYNGGEHAGGSKVNHGRSLSQFDRGGRRK
jgi:hypothetical protein